MRLRLLACVGVCLFGLVAAASASLVRAAVPPGFVQSGALVHVDGVTAMAFTPDQRQLYIASKSGQVFVADVDANADLALRPDAVLDIGAKVCGNGERGLLGVAVDPEYAANKWVYLFYTWDRNATGLSRCRSIGENETVDAASPVNRVSRFTAGANGQLGDERILIDNMPSPAGNHNAGDIHVAGDGTLFVAIGDGGCDYAGGGCGGANDASRHANDLAGKILRIIPDPDLPLAARIPADNPFRATGTICAADGRGPGGTPISTPCQETFASGLRNPFRFVFDPNFSAEKRLYINDVGQSIWEEINRGEAGADYRWNECEGSHDNGTRTPCAPPSGNQRNPIHEYDHAGNDGGGADTKGCHSITDGAVVPNAAWGGQFGGDYLFADYICGTIFRLDLAAGPPYQRAVFADNVGAVVDMTFGPGPHGAALYAADIASGTIFRFTGPNPTNPNQTWKIYVPLVLKP
jgi:glucose/arabinose dehydrogenase